MKNIDKAKLLTRIRKFFKDNHLNITSCGCCGGYHIEIEGEDICEGCDFIEDVVSSIKYYKENSGKIFINEDYYKFTKIDMIKVDNKIVNLGGKSYPFTKFFPYGHPDYINDFLQEKKEKSIIWLNIMLYLVKTMNIIRQKNL